MHRPFDFMQAPFQANYPAIFLILSYQRENVPSNLHTDLICINKIFFLAITELVEPYSNLINIYLSIGYITHKI